jgi:hypothetical protein
MQNWRNYAGMGIFIKGINVINWTSPVVYHNCDIETPHVIPTARFVTRPFIRTPPIYF